MRLVLSSESLDDLEDIYAYSLSTWGLEQADRYRIRLYSALSLLEDQPKLGRVLMGYPRAIRVLRVERHNVFYRIDGDVIRILRLAHSSQNIVPELA